MSEPIHQPNPALAPATLSNFVHPDSQDLAEALRESRQKFESAIEGGGLGVWEWNPQTGLVNYDKSWVGMIGFDPGDVPPYFEFFKGRLHPDDIAQVLNRLVDLINLRTDAFEAEHRMCAAGGQWKWFLNRAKITQRDEQGRAVRVSGVILDITTRKLEDEAQKKRLNILTSPLKGTPDLRFEDLFDLNEIQKIQDAFALATGVASIISDPQGRPITRPSNFCDLCQNIIRKNPKGRACCEHSDAVLGRLNPQGPVIQRCLSGGLMDGGSSIRAGDQHIANWLIGQVLDDNVNEEEMMQYARKIGADETVFRDALKRVSHMPREQFEKVGQALFLIAGQLSRMALQNIQQARYITERQNAEAALQQAKDAAEAATRAKDQFLAVLSHELRTPLTPVLATVSILKAQEDLPTPLRLDMELIQRNIEMEATLIDDLLDITRISRGKIELHQENVNIETCLQAAMEICQPEIASKRLNIERDFQALQHHVWADPARLRQVFWNLLSNAVKFTPEGGRITLRTRNENGRDLKVDVADTGIGIDPKVMSRIFDPFEQGEQSKSRKFGGLGLGLNIAKNVVEMHGGKLTVFSGGTGKGAVFTVQLTTTAPPEKTALPASIAATKERLLKILLVEDHPDTMRVMMKLLQKWGHEVTPADSLAKGKELLERHPFDVLISDLGLPDGSGLDLMRQAKGLHIPGIALSGYGTEEDLRESREAGFREHLVKPINFNALLQTIREINFI